MRRWTAVGTLALMAGVAQADGWKELDGQPCPPLSPSVWINTDREEPTNANLKGKVWLLEFAAVT